MTEEPGWNIMEQPGGGVRGGMRSDNETKTRRLCISTSVLHNGRLDNVSAVWV